MLLDPGRHQSKASVSEESIYQLGNKRRLFQLWHKTIQLDLLKRCCLGKIMHNVDASSRVRYETTLTNILSHTLVYEWLVVVGQAVGADWQPRVRQCAPG